jgi:hypothetical protein
MHLKDSVRRRVWGVVDAIYRGMLHSKKLNIESKVGIEHGFL